MKAKRSTLWGNCAGAAWALGLCLSGQAVFGAPTQWTALYNRGQPTATYVVGDALDYQFEFAINRDTTGWGAEYGLGTTIDGTDWWWYGANWSRMDGNDNRVWIASQYQHRFTSAGTWYYAGRFINGGDTYHVATDWTANSGEPLVAESYFTVNELDPPSYVLVERSPIYPATRALLSWSPMNMDKNVLITMSTESWPDGSPEQGTAYSAGQTFGNQTVVAGSQSGLELEVPGLEPDHVYYFFFYTENNSYYSAVQSAMPLLTARPQARNTNGGSPEVPAEIFLGDAGLPFGLDSWGTLDGDWGRASLWLSYGDSWENIFWGNWTDYTDAEHRTPVSGVFSATGTWHWCVQLDYGGSDPLMDSWWFMNGSSEWADLERNGDVTASGLTVTVQPINDPTPLYAEPDPMNPSSQILLGWDGNMQNHGVMIVRKLATDSWTEPAQGQSSLYNVGDSFGAGTVVYFDPLSPRLGSTMATGLTPSTTYDFKFYSVNASSTFAIPSPYEGVGFYYSSGAEVQATTMEEDFPPVISGCNDIQAATPDGNAVAVSYAVTVEDEDPDPTVIYDPPSGSLFSLGDTMVSVTAWDSSGNTNSCEFTVTVVPDTTPPVINGCSSNHTVLIYDPAGDSVSYSWVSANDAADPNPTVAFDPPSGSVLPLGETLVSVSAWDAAGNTNTCQFTTTVAMTSIEAWGDYGATVYSVPAGPENAVAIAAKYWHALALYANGLVAHESTNMVADISNAVAISAGVGHSLALRSDGTVAAWGGNSYGECNVPPGLSNVVAVSADNCFSLALRADGTVAGWGLDNYGRCSDAARLSNVVAISAGLGGSLAVHVDGTVSAWGPPSSQADVPAGLSNVVALSAGQNHRMALKADGTVVAWGYNGHGRCDVPADLTNAVAIAVGGGHSLALRADGTVTAWGLSTGGQCDVPVGLKNVMAIAAGNFRSLALVRAKSLAEDTTAPVLYGCENRTIQPGTPAIYMVRVLDDVDARPTVIYDPPLGTVLPGGDTVVTVTAWDASGNTNTCQFTATVPVPTPVILQDTVNVREGGEGRFFVRLDRAPEGNVAVNVERVGGSDGFSIQSGATRTFKPSNWNAWQVVTLAAPDDANAAGETATFRVTLADAEDQLVTATALDDDVGENLALTSAGTIVSGKRGYRLADLTDGAHAASTNYAYTTWGTVPPGTITLDLQTAMTVARVRILTWDWSYRDHRYVIESSADGASWTTLADASAGAHRGWEDWPVADESIRYLRLTGLTNSANAGFCVPELEVYGTRPLPEAIQLSKTNVNVRESGEGRFFVRLASAPPANVVVSVARTAGDASLVVQSGASLTFKPSNWSAWQAVTLAQGADANADAETATIQVSMPGVQPRTVTATALDDDVGVNLALASAGTTMTGRRAYFMPYLIDGVHTVLNQYGYTVWTNNPPGTMTLDLGGAATVSRVRVLNWDWTYRVHRYVVEASGDGRNWSLLADASAGAHHGWEEWAVGGAAMRYLRFTGLSNSANTAVCISELEVIGTRIAGRRSLKATAAAESEPVAVLTSEGAESETGWNAVDGDEETAWIGQKAGSGFIVVEYQPALELSALDVILAEGSLTNIEYLYSTDAQNWQPLPDDLESNPISLNYLWLIFPDDGTAAVPQILEIVPNP